MKITAISDIHGDLPIIDPCDVLCICGDILPLEIQKDPIRSIAWLAGRFSNWCEKTPCDKIILIAGNHDFIFETLFKNEAKKMSGVDLNYVIEFFPEYIKDALDLPNKVEYLQDTGYTYKGVSFYGTPHIPELRNWAFYKDSKELKEYFEMIPNKVDVLLTHSPGKFVNNTGVSLQLRHQPEYGSSELTEAIQDRDIKYWFVGHVHSGNHHLEQYNDMMVANVSMKDENYRMVYEPLQIEIEDKYNI
jgi:Icc-related predicted phosphoesterase